MENLVSTILGGCLTTIVVMVIWVILGGWLVSLLWNYVMPDIFGLQEITTLQAMALMFLCRLIWPTSTNIKK